MLLPFNPSEDHKMTSQGIFVSAKENISEKGSVSTNVSINSQKSINQYVTGESKPDIVSLGHRKKTPSISSFLNGTVLTQKIKSEEQNASLKRNSEEKEEPFTEEMLLTKWEEFSKHYIDEPQIYSLFAKKPKLKDQWHIVIPLENSVQQSNLWDIKPAMIGFLSRELNNTKIELESEITESEGKSLIYNDSEKFHVMAQKNPNLLLLKQKFNLDFNS